ncbi:hypothetical protein LEP1GSC162_0527 [Leptospira santarosai str. CBC1531]|nr:hypothetical protein LEP1GSC162_0527 [Leptospira santarosai str. CBC1531]
MTNNTKDNQKQVRNSTQRFLRVVVELLKLAETLGNVSKICNA